MIRTHLPYMRRRDNPIPSQLPHVELMHRQHAVHFRQQPPLYRVHLDMRRHGLQKDQRRVPQQRPDRMQDQHHQEHAERGVDVELVLPFRQPEDQRRDDDDDGAEGVREHVEEDATHVHLRGGRVWVAVVVRAAFLVGTWRRAGVRLIVLVVVGDGELGETVSTVRESAVRVTMATAVLWNNKQSN